MEPAVEAPLNATDGDEEMPEPKPGSTNVMVPDAATAVVGVMVKDKTVVVTPGLKLLIAPVIEVI